MSLPKTTGLKRLILAAADPKRTLADRLKACEAVCRRFPPESSVARFARLLPDRDLTCKAREFILMILFVVGDGAAASGLAAFVNDAGQDLFLRTHALMLLTLLNPVMAQSAAARSPQMRPLAESECRHPACRLDLIWSFFDQELYGPRRKRNFTGCHSRIRQALRKILLID